MDQKTEAEIDKLLAETRKLLAEHDTLTAKKVKPGAEAGKLEREPLCYPVIVAASLMATGAGFAAGGAGLAWHFMH